jgi:hypothetical protein
MFVIDYFKISPLAARVNDEWSIPGARRLDRQYGLATQPVM